jgi:putative FmdB family regulatory protein
MPIYDFECADCCYYTEIKQGMDEPSTHECPHCENQTLVKVFINPPLAFVRGSPSTIGHLADRNTEKMGKYELEDRKNQDGIKKNKEAEQTREMHKKINAMTPQQQVKWIRTGD